MVGLSWHDGADCCTGRFTSFIFTGSSLRQACAENMANVLLLYKTRSADVRMKRSASIHQVSKVRAGVTYTCYQNLSTSSLIFDRYKPHPSGTSHLVSIASSVEAERTIHESKIKCGVHIGSTCDGSTRTHKRFFRRTLLLYYEVYYWYKTMMCVVSRSLVLLININSTMIALELFMIRYDIIGQK